MVQRIPLALVVFPLWDTPVPKVQATRLLVRVVVDAICAIAPANDRGWMGGFVTIRTYRPVFIYLLGVLILES